MFHTFVLQYFFLDGEKNFNLIPISGLSSCLCCFPLQGMEKVFYKLYELPFLVSLNGLWMEIYSFTRHIWYFQEQIVTISTQNLRTSSVPSAASSRLLPRAD